MKKLSYQGFINQGSFLRCVLQLYVSTPKRYIAHRVSQRARISISRMSDWRTALYSIAEEEGVRVDCIPSHIPDKMHVTITLTR